MNAARNSPSLFPPFTSIWSDTEIDPALSPQLKDISRLHIEKPVHLHCDFRRISTECVNILLYPMKRHTLYRPDVRMLIIPTPRTLTIPQPEIAYVGIFDFLTGQETEG